MAPPYSKLMSQLTTGSGSLAQAGADGDGSGGTGPSTSEGGASVGSSSRSQSSSHSRGGKGSNSNGKRANNNAKAGTVRPRLRRQEEELLRQVQAGRRVEVTATTAGDNHSHNNNDSDHGTATPSEPSEEQAAMMAMSAVAMNPRIMQLQRQIAREAALMATMTSAAQQQGQGQQGGQQVQPPRQHPGQLQQQMQPMMMPTHGNGITYNAIGGMNSMGGLLHHHYAYQNQQQQHNLTSSSHASASSSVSSSSKSGGSVGTTGSSSSKKKSGKRRKSSSRGDARLERDGISPPFFHGKKLRSGVWLQAEIEYAMEIIQDFRRGNLPDCPNGATLRQYLAKKLHCNPMRLSKKLSKAMGNTPESSLGGGNSGSNGPGYAHRAAASASPTQRRMALELAFHQATLDRKAVLATSAANSVCSSKGPTPPPASVASAAKDKNKPVNAPPLFVLPVGGQPQIQGLATVPVSNPFAMPMYQSGQQQQPQPMISTNALEGALLLQNQASMQAQMASQMRQIQELQESLTEAKAELEEKEKAAKHQAELHQSFLRALQSKVSSSGSSGSQQAADKPNSGETSDKATEKGGSNSTADYTELLAGFEEVAAAPAAASGGATDLDAAQIPLWSNVDTALSLGMPGTPTLTSRSFDDFHRFLGQGIPSMPNLARGDQSAAPSNGNGGEGGVRPRPIAVAALNGPATEALHGERGAAFATGDISFNANSTDDYSMLAQQSVLAAMQHSAYAAPLETNAAAGTAASGTKRNTDTVSEANSTSSSSSEPASKRVRIVPSTQRSTASSSSNSSNNNVTLVSGTESESIFDSSSRGATSSSGSGSDNDNSNDWTTSNDGSDDAGIESFGEPNATAKIGLATNATEKEATMEVSSSEQETL